MARIKNLKKSQILSFLATSDPQMLKQLAINMLTEISLISSISARANGSTKKSII